ncbi:MULTISPECIES: hypothetical protein [unclassified Colwellia]|jgi:hypothetical protein|uniref:hypothetical protein n=1 Tax=unclassified Colwellia TaxID=196834 RepID=UPI0015F42C39|nr:MULTISPECIES: hypothetical protein [unclassified Colwellia]MBA6252458.1 hypothetical protein [Colwellia sp. MB3u-55]MBA6399141.1 hypothetical protein [Colwellia sp. BRX10-4]
MKVQHIIDDLESVFSKQPETKEYDVAFACYSEDGSGSIEIDYVKPLIGMMMMNFFLFLKTVRNTMSEKQLSIKQRTL